ncbi:hypothetical protein B4589_006885 [Halolamina sp. CBA1230]|uniref:hypothetical protein n=1 Tax=Halolamina sp. CBA1230 TaxID=1853690 RepID=UPI0009A18627|nr:hypothetical protein [Halolamina sp. CBA1230]QKY20118.1 hypothetical protein B4589_006885 [Halolamina sp. CBA1230]
MLPPDAPSRSDLHLLFIPLALAGGVATAVLSSLSLVVGAAVGSLLASLAVVDGLAIHPPTRE